MFTAVAIYEISKKATKNQTYFLRNFTRILFFGANGSALYSSLDHTSAEHRTLPHRNTEKIPLYSLNKPQKPNTQIIL